MSEKAKRLDSLIVEKAREASLDEEDEPLPKSSSKKNSIPRPRTSLGVPAGSPSRKSSILQKSPSKIPSTRFVPGEVAGSAIPSARSSVMSRRPSTMGPDNKSGLPLDISKAASRPNLFSSRTSLGNSPKDDKRPSE